MKGTSALVRSLGLALIAVFVGLPAASSQSAEAAIQDPEVDRAYRLIDKAKSKAAGDTRGQADVLVSLAWPDDGADPMVSSMAREQLTQYGPEGLQSLRQAIPRVAPRYQFDVIAAALETKSRITGGLPSEYLPTVEDAIWFGSLEAKRIAIPEAARYRYPLAVLSIIDAAYEHPQLVALAAQALGDFRNDRARRFLKEVMQTGHPHERRLAARALGRIGTRGLSTLRDAARDEDRGCRTAALETLLPVTSTDDLSLLYEYITSHPDEEPTLHRMVVLRATLLESVQEKQMAADSASGE